jgi:hypothetical protein
MPEQTLEQLLTVAQLSELLVIPQETLYKWRYLDRGPKGMKIGKHLRYAPQVVQFWLDAQQESL